VAHVVVVGAGFGGLSAAVSLRDRGHTVRVFEARDRVGGRVHTLRDFIPGRHVEAGGELIGRIHHTWLGYARRFGLGLSVITDEAAHEGMGLREPLLLRGRSLGDEEEAALWEGVEAVEARLSAAARAAVPDPERPWAAPEAARLDGETVSDWLDGACETPLVRHWMAVHLESEFGVPAARMSLLGLLAQIAGDPEEYWTDYESFRCADGNQALADALAATLGAALSLSAPVSAIALSGSGATVTAGGHTEQADAVVLAVPPSVWDQIDIQPGLPAGYRPQMGLAMKYLARVSRRLWIRHGLAPSGYSEDIGSLWESTDQQGGPDRIGLTVFAGGALAEQGLSAPDPAARFRAGLAAVFPDFAEHDEGGRLCPWPTEPWTRGGYSTPAPGEVTGALRLLNTAPWQGRLVFAGEHTDPRFYGFMEGALRSGVRAAEQVTQL